MIHIYACMFISNFSLYIFTIRRMRPLSRSPFFHIHIYNYVCHLSSSLSMDTYLHAYTRIISFTTHVCIRIIHRVHHRKCITHLSYIFAHVSYILYIYHFVHYTCLHTYEMIYIYHFVHYTCLHTYHFIHYTSLHT